MFQPRSIQSSLSFRDKLFSIDYVLVFSVLVLGIVSMFAMYSTDGGEFKYHTNSHILRFCVFFVMFIISTSSSCALMSDFANPISQSNSSMLSST